MKSQFSDSNGVPMTYLGKRGTAIFNTNIPNNSVKNESGADMASSDIKDTDFIRIDKYKVAGWFDTGNKRPWEVRENYLRKSAVLQSAINYKNSLAMSQGIFACTVEDITPEGAEVVKNCTDMKVKSFLASRAIRKMQSASYDNLYRHGNGFVHIILGKGSNEVSIVESLDAPFCRLGEKKKGALTDLLYYSRWHERKPSGNEYQRFPVIDTRMPIELQIEQAKKFKSFIYPIDFKKSGSIYYADEPWAPALASGHLDITLKVAKFTASMFDNQASIKYHVQIPYSYWEGLYPIRNFPADKDKEERERLISARLDEIEADLCSSENSRKTIISHYSTSDDGKPRDGWKIDVIDDKLTSQHYLPQAAASNAEVFTAMEINPAVRGLQMSAGPYANQSGGSNIREAFLVDSALAWGDRQEVIDPIYFMLRLQGKDYDIRTRQTVLTTLDTGKGTSKTVS